MFKPQKFKAAKFLGCFVNETRQGDLQLKGRPSPESEWSFTLTLQGVKPVDLIEWVRGTLKEMPQPLSVMASFTRSQGDEFFDIDLDVEFTEDGRCIVSSGQISMTFRWSRKLYETNANTYSSYKESDRAFIYGLIVEGTFPLTQLEAVAPASQRQRRNVKPERAALAATVVDEDDVPF